MEANAIKVLLIEDNLGDARLIRESLVDVMGFYFQLTHRERLAQGIELLNSELFDVVILDLSLPDYQGLETLMHFHQQAPDLPIVVLTGVKDETLALRAVQAGAQDFLVKGQVTGELLARSLRYAIERQDTELKLREQAALLDITTDAIFVMNLQGKIIYWNQGAERLYGWKAEEVLNQPTKTYIDQEGEPEPRVILERTLAQGQWQGELSKVTRTGKKIIVQSAWNLVLDTKGQAKSILVVNSDLTQKKQLEAQILRAQRLESIGTLASGIAHDLNNILTPIVAGIPLLRMQPNASRNDRLLTIMEKNAKRGAELIRQVLSFARGVEGVRTQIQVRLLIDELRQVMEETFPKTIRIHTQIADDLWLTIGDISQIHQVLMNLCVNAGDAMPRGGYLTLGAENIEIDQTYAKMHLDAKVGRYLVLSVTDTGSGMDADTLNRIFDPFFTSKPVGKGTGLGLSTAMSIVKSHGGFIHVTSEVGIGSQFLVYLPAQAIDAPEPSVLPEISMVGQGQMILVVDDEPTIQITLSELLTSYSYTVLTTGDGLKAVELYTQYQDQIQVIIVDMIMPQIDGPTTIELLRKVNPAVKFVACSGLTPAVDLKADAFLAKPYTSQELLEILAHLVRPPGPNGARIGGGLD